MTQPDMRDLMAREGATVISGTPEEFKKVIAADLTRWSKLIRDRNITKEARQNKMTIFWIGPEATCSSSRRGTWRV